MSYKIVADSSADLLSLGNAPFAVASLTIRTAEKEFVDNAQLDVAAMQEFLLAYKGQSSTACPNVSDYRTAFGDAETVVCVTITDRLSGSYNAACLAAKEYTEAHPDRHVLVVDSISTGPESALLLEKLHALLEAGKSIGEIRDSIAAYQKNVHLLFALESMHNLARNGRISPIKAKMAGILGIRAIGRASNVGTLEMVCKARGEQKTVSSMVEIFAKNGYKGGRMKIHHAENPRVASLLADAVRKAFPTAEPEIASLRGLCSFYAERGGILVGYEGGEFEGKDTRILLV